jgi:hypothetical protein
MQQQQSFSGSYGMQNMDGTPMRRGRGRPPKMVVGMENY